MPQGLKGDLGEFYVMKKLVANFPDRNIVFLGGITRDIDILFETKKIQVKTYINKNFNIYSFNIDMCPDLKSDFKETCDYVVLIQVFLTEQNELDDIKTRLYIFDKDDFDFFNTPGCWGAKHNRVTIWNVPAYQS